MKCEQTIVYDNTPINATDVAVVILLGCINFLQDKKGFRPMTNSRDVKKVIADSLKECGFKQQ